MRNSCRISKIFFQAFVQEDRPILGDAGNRHRLQDEDRTKSLMRVMHPHRTDPRAMEWYLNPSLDYWLGLLLGRPALGAQTMFYYKPPGSRGQGMHQDNFYLLSRPATCIAAWTPIDDTDEENGCLWVVPGSNHYDIQCPEPKSAGKAWLNYGDTHITRFPRETKPVPVLVRRGQTMFFNGNLIHGSGPNRSKTRWRRTFIGHYIDEASEAVARFYHPVLNMRGETVSHVAEEVGGGPCGGWAGGVH
jgi:hypothetical protein